VSYTTDVGSGYADTGTVLVNGQPKTEHETRGGGEGTGQENTTSVSEIIVTGAVIAGAFLLFYLAF